MNPKEYCVSPDASILEAMRVIDSTAIATTIVCHDMKVLGILTDGDIRRALLKGAGLHDSIDPFYSKNFVKVSPEDKRADVLDLMQARVIEQIPVVNTEGSLVGIHTLHGLLGNRKKPNRALIMAGGKGTRLGKLTQSIPKPMIKVAGRPILERLILHLVGHGIRSIYVSVNHLSHVIEDYFGDGSKWGCEIIYLRETTPLGSGGALSLINEALTEPLILMNGDLLLEMDISEMIRLHDENNFYLTVGVHSYAHEVPYGCIEIKNNRVVTLEEKPLITKTVNAGVYILSPEAVNSVPKNTYYPATAIIEEALDFEKHCGAYRLDGDWIDIGEPDQLRKARGATF